MEESHDLSNHRSSEHIFCGFGRRSSQITNYENYYYGMDEGSDQTTYSEEDDEYDENTVEKGDCESSFQYASSKRNSASGRLSRRNVATRLDRHSENDNTFRNRSKWKKYYYQAVSRSMPIQEEDEITAGPSTATTDPFSDSKSTTIIDASTITNLTIDNEKNKHVIIHVNEFEFEDDDDDDDDAEELSLNEEIGSDKKSISENDSLLVAYDSNSVSSV